MTYTRAGIEWVLFSGAAFGLLLSVMYAFKVRGDLSELAQAPGIDEVQRSDTEDDWIREQMATSAFEEVAATLRDRRFDLAREEMLELIRKFPNSASADESRRILTEMNLDGLRQREEGAKGQIYKVKPGDSPLAIASRFGTSYHFLRIANPDVLSKGLKPGDQLLVRPLNFEWIIDLGSKSIEVREDGEFFATFPILAVVGMNDLESGQKVVSAIDDIHGLAGSRKILPTDEQFIGSAKVIRLKYRAVTLHAEDALTSGNLADAKELSRVVTSRAAMAELTILARPRNSVVIRR